MSQNEREYSNQEITIAWNPHICAHSTKCWKGENGLISVFNPFKKPWINAEGAENSEIIQRIKNCPSGALSFYYNSDKLIK